MKHPNQSQLQFHWNESVWHILVTKMLPGIHEVYTSGLSMGTVMGKGENSGREAWIVDFPA